MLTIFIKLFNLIKVHGWKFTGKFLLTKIFLFSKRGNFVFRGETFDYFFHRYNNTWDHERCVEIPIFKKYLGNSLENNETILEIGNVLSHYLKKNWLVVDKFEKEQGVVNIDINSFESQKKFDLIISISTMEHIGFEAVEHVKSLLSDKGIFIFSIPIGFNKDFDAKILSIGIKALYLKRVSYRSWKEVTEKEIQNSKYDYPYDAANALAICYVEKD